MSGDKNKIKYLVDQGADKESRTNGGYTPLMLAAKSGSLHAVQMCLNSGMNPF